MKTYLLLLRGINVGGKNKVPMQELKNCLEGLGFSRVLTYIASGNVIVDSDKPAAQIQTLVENALTDNFRLDSELIKVLVLSKAQLRAMIDGKPRGFGDEPNTYRYDAIFLIDIAVDEAMKVFDPREGVDVVWPGDGIIYSQRLIAQVTKSRINKIVGTPAYSSMTIRNWNTTTKLLKLLEEQD